MEKLEKKDTAIGQVVKHTEQKYTGKIASDLGGGYCMVDLDSQELRNLYPFGIRAKIDKLIILSTPLIIE